LTISSQASRPVLVKLVDSQKKAKESERKDIPPANAAGDEILIPAQPLQEKVTFNFDEMRQVISDVLKAYGGKRDNILHLLRGTSKKGEWASHNMPADNPVTAAELVLFGKWYARTCPDCAPPSTAEGLQSWFLRYRDETKSRKPVAAESAEPQSTFILPTPSATDNMLVIPGKNDEVIR
jgi:hypothetical protein